MDSYQLGQWTAVVFPGIIAFFFLFKAMRSKVRSARLVNLSLFFGLLVFCRPEMVIDIVNIPTLNGIVASARTILGCIGLVCGIIAIRFRVKDQGVTLTRTILGMLFSLLHMVGGVALLFLLSFFSGGPDNSSWVYRSSEHGFSLTLPTSDWVQIGCRNGAVAFKNRRYPMQAIIYMRTATEEHFRAEVETLRKESISNLQHRKHEKGKTEKGYVFDFTSGVERAKDKSNDVYVAICHFWCPDRGRRILIIFEGCPKMASQFGTSLELNLFEDSARSICFSFE
jgi:hypothetical protein